MTAIEMRQRRAALREEANELLNKAVGGVLGPEDEQRYQRIDADIDALTANIARAEKLEEERKKEEEILSKAPVYTDGKEDRNAPVTERTEYRDAFRNHLIDPNSLTSEQRKILMEGRALSAVTGASGGYTVPQGFYNQIQDAMKWYGGMRQVGCTPLTTTGGNDIPVPTANDTSNVGELLGENATATTQDVTFGQVILKAYKYSSKVVLVPFELLQDSAFNIEQYIARKLGERLGRITNTHFTTGDNSSKPQGVVTAAAAGKVGATGQTTSIIYDDLIDLIHSVDPAYRLNGGFMMHDLTVKALKKLKDGQGRPLWVPGVDVKEPDTIGGYKYTVNNDMPQMAVSAKSILFGDFSNYFIRDVMDLTLFRISDKYIESGQVGFLCFYRGDGRMVDAGLNPIKYYQNSAS